MARTKKKIFLPICFGILGWSHDHQDRSFGYRGDLKMKKEMKSGLLKFCQVSDEF